MGLASIWTWALEKPMKSILKVIAGSFYIILVFYRGEFTYLLIFEGFTTKDLFWFTGLFLVGFLMFGLPSGTFKKPFFSNTPLNRIFGCFYSRFCSLPSLWKGSYNYPAGCINIIIYYSKISFYQRAQQIEYLFLNIFIIQFIRLGMKA